VENKCCSLWDKMGRGERSKRIGTGAVTHASGD
jgi:hypothetical protein